MSEAVDLETLKFGENTGEFEVIDSKYAAMRLKLVYQLWPFVQEALNSPWSNIRSICYGLICSMLKIDVRDCMPHLPYKPLPIGSDLGRQDQETDRQLTKEFEEKDKLALEKSQHYIKLK